MPAVQRHVTAIAAMALAMFVVVAGCGATDRSDIATTGAVTPSGEGSTTAATTTVPVATPTSTPTTVAPFSSGSVADDASSSTDATDGSDGGAATDGPASLAAGVAAVTADSPDPTTDEALTSVDEAVDRKDICGVYSGLARFDLGGTSTVRLIAQLTRIRAIMVRSAEFVTASLAADWAALTDGTSDMLASLERTVAADRTTPAGRRTPAASGESASVQFDDDSYRAASRHVAAWMESNCA